MNDRRFSFHSLTEEDLPLLWDWLNRPHLLEWWSEEQSLDEVREKYLPRIRDPSAATPFLACLLPEEHTEEPESGAAPSRGEDLPLGMAGFARSATRAGDPVGYIQYYVAAHGDPEWWPDEPGPGVVGIDQFLAEEGLLGKGLGTAMVSRFCRRLFQDERVTEIRVDPRPDNARAIRCYEKVGFRSRGEITTPDGAALMMVLERG